MVDAVRVYCSGLPRDNAQNISKERFERGDARFCEMALQTSDGGVF